MNSDPNRFTAKTKQILEKRANSTCSNPFCSVVTSGPHTKEDQAINLGEAAHIKGANPGSRRYDSAMLPEERANIVNAIWLCSKCAKLIDSDEVKYTEAILFKWKRDHEIKKSNALTGENWASETAIKILEKLFSNESPTALQIAIDKPRAWEYLLTIELLREKMKRIQQDYADIQRGVVYGPMQIMDTKEYIRWFRESINNMSNIVHIISIVINIDLVESWGDPGIPGDLAKIKAATDKIERACNHLLDWELSVRFTEGPEAFSKVQQGMQGWTNEMITEISKISHEMSKPILDDYKAGEYVIKLEFLPPKNLNIVADEFVRIVKKTLK